MIKHWQVFGIADLSCYDKIVTFASGLEVALSKASAVVCDPRNIARLTAVGACDLDKIF